MRASITLPTTPGPDVAHLLLGAGSGRAIFGNNTTLGFEEVISLH